MAELHLTNDNFDAEVLQSPVPVLVDFFAVWCGPCKVAIPHLNELSKKYAGDGSQPTVQFVGVSVWERITADEPYWVPRFVKEMGYGVKFYRLLRVVRESASEPLLDVCTRYILVPCLVAPVLFLANKPDAAFPRQLLRQFDWKPVG